MCTLLMRIAFFMASLILVAFAQDYTCDQNGYSQYLSQWTESEKCTSRDPASSEYQERLELFINSCEKILEWNSIEKYQMEFTFYADWSSEEFESITATRQRYSGIKPNIPVTIPVYNNSNIRHLLPATVPCDEQLQQTICRPQQCSISWAFAVTESIELAIRKMYLENYDQNVEVSLSAQELIDCVPHEMGVEGNLCIGFPLLNVFDYVYENGIAYTSAYPITNVRGQCKSIADEKRYFIAGYEKPTIFNKYGLFDLVMKGPTAVSLGIDPEHFQYYQSDRENGPYFDSSYWRPSIYGVIIEYKQYTIEGQPEHAAWPYFAIDTTLRAGNPISFRLPILDTTQNANIAGIAGFAIRPIVHNVLPTVAPTLFPPTLHPPTVPPEFVTCPYLANLPLNATTLIVPDNSCNEGEIVTFDLSAFRDLETIVIGNDCFMNVPEFRIDGLLKLTSIKIGSGTFTKQKQTGTGYDPDRSLHIMNCISLKSIDIGEESFRDYSGDLDLRNLPNLEYLKIGELSNNDWASFRWGTFVLRDHPKLKTLVLGGLAYQFSLHTIIENLPELTEIRMADEALLGRDDSTTSLTMRNLPKLERIVSDVVGYNFYQVRYVVLENIPNCSYVYLPYSFRSVVSSTITNVHSALANVVRSRIGHPPGNFSQVSSNDRVIV